MFGREDWKAMANHHFAHALFARNDWKAAVQAGRHQLIVNGLAKQRRTHIKYALMARSAARA